MIYLVAFLVFFPSRLRYALKTLFELWTIAYLGKYSPVFSVQTFLRDERSHVSNMSSVRPGCLLSEGLPLSRSVFRDAAAELTIWCDVHFHRRASSKNTQQASDQSPASLGLFTFISLTPDPWMGISENKHTFKESDLWPPTFQKKCVDFT